MLHLSHAFCMGLHSLHHLASLLFISRHSSWECAKTQEAVSGGPLRPSEWSNFRVPVFLPLLILERPFLGKNQHFLDSHRGEGASAGEGKHTGSPTSTLWRPLSAGFRIQHSLGRGAWGVSSPTLSVPGSLPPTYLLLHSPGVPCWVGIEGSSVVEGRVYTKESPRGLGMSWLCLSVPLWNRVKVLPSILSFLYLLSLWQWTWQWFLFTLKNPASGKWAHEVLDLL